MTWIIEDLTHPFSIAPYFNTSSHELSKTFFFNRTFDSLRWKRWYEVWCKMEKKTNWIDIVKVISFISTFLLLLQIIFSHCQPLNNLCLAKKPPTIELWTHWTEALYIKINYCLYKENILKRKPLVVTQSFLC